MTFEETVDQAMAMLERRGRMTYRALKRQFNLDDTYLEDLTAELIEAQQVAIDEGGTVLVWTGSPATVAVRTGDQARVPLSYTPPYLAEKILTSKAVLEGERKQVTVLFADLKGSMELLADRDPEEARQLLDPVLERMIEAVHRYEGTVNQVMGAPHAGERHAVRRRGAALPRRAGADPGRAEFRGSGGAGHRQQPAHGLHGGGPDHPPGGPHGADGEAGLGAHHGGDPTVG
jgi:hypothetical protein